LARRLAGCVQILGTMSKDLYEEVERTIKEVHPYDVPEIIALPILKGNPSYLQWLSEETRGNS